VARRPRQAVFLERSGYRRRRLQDAARLLPVMGAGLFMVPLLWPMGQVSNVTALIYLFGAWLILIIGAALLARRLARKGDG
jgi:hypothetical protein